MNHHGFPVRAYLCLEHWICGLLHMSTQDVRGLLVGNIFITGFFSVVSVLIARYLAIKHTQRQAQAHALTLEGLLPSLHMHFAIGVSLEAFTRELTTILALKDTSQLPQAIKILIDISNRILGYGRKAQRSSLASVVRANTLASHLSMTSAMTISAGLAVGNEIRQFTETHIGGMEAAGGARRIREALFRLGPKPSYIDRKALVSQRGEAEALLRDWLALDCEVHAALAEGAPDAMELLKTAQPASRGAYALIGRHIGSLSFKAAVEAVIRKLWSRDPFSDELSAKARAAEERAVMARLGREQQANLVIETELVFGDFSAAEQIAWASQTMPLAHQPA